MAHMGGLRALATGIYTSIIPAQQTPTSHPTCTHTLHSLSSIHTGVGTSWQPNSGIPKEHAIVSRSALSRPEKYQTSKELRYRLPGSHSDL
jgi:hypothetical protein